MCFVAQSCLTLCDPMDFSPPDSTGHGDSPGKNTGMGCHALPQEESSQPRDQTQVTCIVGRFFTVCATREAQEYWKGSLSLLQGIFSTQESNLGLLYCRRILYQWSYRGNPTGTCCSVIYCCLVTESCPLWTLCDPKDCSAPGFLVFRYLPEFDQTQESHTVGESFIV